METRLSNTLASRWCTSHCSSVWEQEIKMRSKYKYAAGTRKTDDVLRQKGAGFEQIYDQCLVTCGSAMGLDVTELRKSCQNPHYPLIRPEDAFTDKAKEYVAEWEAEHKRRKSS